MNNCKPNSLFVYPDNMFCSGTSTSLSKDGCGNDGLFSIDIPEIKYVKSDGAIEALRSLFDEYVKKSVQHPVDVQVK
jgi:hypothetical protein